MAQNLDAAGEHRDVSYLEHSEVQPADPGSVHVLFRRDATRIVLTGEVDAELSSELVEAAEEAVRSGKRVEVDAHHVTFMDSTGISFLARLAGQARSEPLMLIGPPDVVRFLVDVTAIGELLHIVAEDPHPYNDRDDATV